MAVVTTVEVVETALWPQGDIRDPLGIWGARVQLTGDASAGSLKATIFVPAERKSAYIYTCYSAIIVQIAGSSLGFNAKIRLLANWPNIDPQAGVQGYATGISRATNADADFTPPNSLPDFNLIGPNDRFILLFDPRPIGDDLAIVEIESGNNPGVGTNFSAEAYGYFWDRSVLNAPGGPRHPGAS